jgi:predicted ATPase
MITNLTLENFKCFEKQALPLRNLTVLAGLNGMGKSSVIQSLLLLRQSHEQNLLAASGITLNGDLVKIGTAQDALYTGAAEEVIGLGLDFEDGTQAEWRLDAGASNDMLDLVSPEVGAGVFEQSLFTSSFHYVEAERLGPRTTFEVSDDQVRRRGQLGTRGEFTAHFLEVHGREPIGVPALAHPEARSEALIDQVEAWTATISPGTRIHTAAIDQIDLVHLRYSFVTERAVSNEFRATNVGFGLTYTLPILVAVLSAKPGSLILLENPEAHLHPKGQVGVGMLFARAATAGVQILVETHSDHLLNGMRLAVHEGSARADKLRMYFFERIAVGDVAQATATAIEVDENGRLDQWPDGFFDQWDKATSALLFPEPQVA